ncbi:hypothetical protein HK101_000267 [Irineochytrium annulatum]|nr:hypothetical protein HK101_000267 [Irineochytrium annulatum]
MPYVPRLLGVIALAASLVTAAPPQPTTTSATALPATATATATASGPRVVLDYAAVTGYVDPNGLRVFKGIPYAQPPVKGLRFKSPEPIVKNLGELDASQFGHVCPQAESVGSSSSAMIGSEDCLTLNIWSPPAAAKAGGTGLPVMIYVHGGALVSGASSMPEYDPTAIVTSQSNSSTSVIFVSFNYRLGALGWLASDSLLSEGSLNLGLQDQRAAMQWVQKYIGNFGGNPAKITVWGQESGAVSIATHLFTSQPPVFQQAILESGSSLFLNMNYTDMFPVYTYIVVNLGCGNESSTIACLRNASVDSIMNADFQAQGGAPADFYNPYIDGTLLKERPAVLLASKNFSLPAIPVLLGLDTNDGSIFTGNVQSTDDLWNFANHTFSGANLTQLQDLYTSTSASPSASASELFGDFQFDCPIRALADAVSTLSARAYKYRFNHVPSSHPDDGVRLSSEVPFTFNNSAAIKQPDEQDLATAMSQAWVNFAVNGDPNIGGALSSSNFVWPPYIADRTWKSGGGKVIRFDGGAGGGVGFDVEDDKQPQCEFWGSYAKTATAPPKVPVAYTASATATATAVSGDGSDLGSNTTATSSSSADRVSTFTSMATGLLALTCVCLFV